MSDEPFPLNIAKVVGTLKTTIAERDKDIELKVMQDKSYPASLATVKVFDTRSTLYYIPVAPLWELMSQKGQERSAGLLTSVMSYLLQVVEIPHFAQDFSFLAGIYEMVVEWLTGDLDDVTPTDRDYFFAEYQRINEAGLCLLMHLSDKRHLKVFRSRLRNFRPSCPLENRLKKIAGKAFTLYRDYPCRSLMHSMREPNDTVWYEGYITPDQYVHFYWSERDCFAEDLFSNVNGQLNECSAMQEPVAIQFFDEPQEKVSLGHDFEERLFSLLNDLITFLNDL